MGTKGSVQEALIAAKYLPDPFVGSNEAKFQWIENYDWTFEATFDLTQIDPGKEYDLDFPSLDTYAKVYLNGFLCGSGENAFVHYQFDVKKLLKQGKNTVKVVFTSPVNAKKAEAQNFLYPAPNDVGSIKVAPYCRKPQYQFGWDWSLRMTTIGFWEPASLISYENNRVIGRNIRTEKLTDSTAEQSFLLELREECSETTYIWESVLFGTKEVQSWDTHVTRKDVIKNPELWWPRGQGKQHLYNDVWTLKTLDGKVLYTDTVTFGVRTTELVQEKDKWGTSFQLIINGLAIFCKGADYIPDDIFPARITDEQLRKSVATMAECNFNMIRIWGGGMYAKEEFLDACDELGIMVWHDFMFACAMYPGNESFLKNVSAELDQQIPRLASHPSLVYFNGNNEVDVAWKNWGFQQQYKISDAHQKIILDDYNKLFKELIPEKVSYYTRIPYVHTSPLSNWGKEDFYNHGTQHYWGVWHGKDPMNDMTKKIGRFNAEFGFQSFPEYSTLKQFSDTSEWSLFSATMKNHQKSYVGNSMIAKHSDLLFGPTDDFEQFVYFSQLTQAKAVESAVVAHRLNAPRCSGTLFWQFNDCWPAISWSSIDYYGNWKALNYRIRDAYADVAIVKDPATDACKYFIISDSPEGFLCQMTCEVRDLKGALLGTYQCKRAIMQGHSTVFEQELKAFDSINCNIKITWTDALSNLKQLSEFHTIKANTSKQNYRPTISFELNRKIRFQAGAIVIETTEPLEDFWISSVIPGVHFEENFIDLLPGIHSISYTYNGKKPELTDFTTNWR